MLKRLAKQLLSHRRKYYVDRLFRRVSKRRLARFFDALGVRPGMVLYVQASFSCLGYHPAGPRGAIEVLLDLLGASGTLVMPSFPFRGTMAHFVSAEPVFDVRKTPSKIGALPEALRTHPEATRSVHPTHPVAAVGAMAADIVEGHERTTTPQGPDSPFARMIELDARILRIGAGAYPFCHHLQELVDYPNLFLDEPVHLRCLDRDGRPRSVETRVYRPTLPFVLFRDGGSPGRPVATNLVDFPYLHRGEREAVMEARPDWSHVLEHARRVRKEAERSGGLSCDAINGCQCDLFPASDSMDHALAAGAELIERYRDLYDPDTLEAALADGSVRI